MMRQRVTPKHNNAPVTKRRLFSIALAAGLLVISGIIGVTAGQQSSKRLMNELAQGGNDAASIMFRSGRDLITDQEWSKAQDKFNQFITTYPNDKNVDAAYYWMAYAQNKQSKTNDSKQTLKVLLEKYPNSAWREDARVLLAQVATGYAVTYPSFSTPAAMVAVEPQIVYAPAPAAIGIGQSGSATIWADDEAKGNDDDPCEFRIVVLQALFQTDVQRGIVVATDWLKSGSGQTVRCKGAALTLLGRNGGKSVTPVILGVARNETDLKLRARAISALGATNDDSVIDALRDFAVSSSENDIAEASLYALSRHTSDRAIVVLGEIAGNNSKPPTLRRQAISMIATRPGEPAVDALLKLYDSDQTLEIRRAVISGFGNRKSERAGAKLVEIVRGSDVIELRKAAVSALSRRGGDKVIDTLLSLYDSEKNEEVKDQIMNSLGSGTVLYTPDSALGRAVTVSGGTSSRMNDQRVIRKLIEIARNPQTPMDRRKRAIGWLSRSNDPEVLKFLEDLLK
ncbi:MAG TPA: HEAT repeat domain-containing protein [Pyrinomonadaceae bacterium]